MARRKLRLVVSDTHLGAGMLRGQPNPLEEFFHDDRFAELLEHHRRGQYADCDVELVLNGDIFDLLKIKVGGVWPTEITEEIACEKLRMCLDGHPVFCEAIRRHLESPGSTVVYLPGNHDMDLQFPTAQALFRERVAPGALGERVRFITTSDTYYLPEGIQIRHGHQLESIHQFDYKNIFVEGKRGGRVLNLPWGSLWILEVLNPMKQERHHLDHIVPFKRLVLLGLVFDLGFTLRLCARVAFHFVRSRLAQVTRWRTRIRTTLRILRDEMRPLADFDRTAERSLMRVRGVHTLILGHSHGAKCKALPGGKMYVNTGTWIRHFSLDLETLGQEPGITYAIVEYTDEGTPVTSLMRWLGTPRRSEVVYYRA